MHIKIETNKGIQFEFNFHLGKEKPRGTAVGDLVNPFTLSAKRFLEEHINIKIESMECQEIFEPEKLGLNEVTALIVLRGEIQSIFVLSVDRQVLRKIARKFILDDISEEEIEDYMEDVLAESTNTIVGNSLKLLPATRDFLNIDTPVSFASEAVHAQFQKAAVSSCRIKTEAGLMSISLVVPSEIKNKIA